MKGTPVKLLATVVLLCLGPDVCTVPAAEVDRVTVGQDNRLCDRIFYEAFLLNSAGDLASAFDLYRQCLELNPAMPAAKYYLAVLYSSMGDQDRSEKLLRDIVRDEPDNYWYWRALAVHLERTRQYAAAIETYSSMADRFPPAVNELSTLVDLLSGTGRPREALSVLDRLENIEGESIEGTVKRFELYIGMHSMDSAYMVIRPHLDWALPAFSDAVSNISELNAVQYISQRAARDFPGNPVYPYYCALSLFRSGHTDEALAAIDDAVERIPEDADREAVSKLYVLRGDISYSAKDMPSVFSAYSKAIELNPADLMTANNYAYFLSVHGRDLEKALSLSLETIRQEPANSTYLDTYAWILFRLGRYGEARIYSDAALLYDTGRSADVAEHCGDIHYMDGDTEGAVELWHKAVEYHSTSVTLEKKLQLRKYVETPDHE